MSNKNIFNLVLVSLLWFSGCTYSQTENSVVQIETKTETIAKIKNEARVIHVLVALCDNKNQGIVPVPAAIGNGEDAQKNLYWGAAYGVKTFFGKSANWTKIAEIDNPKENILQRIVFKHKRENVYFVADAYQGSKMRETIDDFFAAASGAKLENIKINDLTVQILGSANVIAFVGHNGLMDFDLKTEPQKKDDEPREAIILACASRNYFSAPLKKTSATPLVWTTNLMAPEAYILHDALEGWVKNESAQQIRIRAAAAYAKYQKISQRSAENLLVTGW